MNIWFLSLATDESKLYYLWSSEEVNFIITENSQQKYVDIKVIEVFLYRQERYSIFDWKVKRSYYESKF